ncbi:MAG: DNA mismatch repair protein MutS [Syntrophales bacterium]|nr:DNA mismatch repair protein MutS [Syntrophales bacterium]
MNLTPAMKQYVEIKEQHKDCILLFRMGDFYEMFFEDAVTAAKVLDITLTSRNKGKEDSVPLCGFPYHAASTYIARLIERGFKVAICEQMEDPKDARGIVKRDVVRIVTPGLVVDADNLEANENNFLAALTLGGTDDILGLAFLDISTGEFRVTASHDREFFLAEVSGLDFREVIVQEDYRESSFLKAFSRGANRCRINYFSADYFDHDAALARLQEYFSGDQLKQLKMERHPAMVAAAGAILRYVEETQKNNPRHINDIQWYKTDGYLLLDETAKRNLELFTTITDGRKQGTLFHVLDETVTSMGARRLRWWLNYPLVVPEKIRERLSAVSEIREHHLLRENLRRSLGRVYDLERLGGRISLGVANGRDLIALLASLQALPEIRSALHELRSSLITSICAGIDEMPDILELIERAILEDPPLTLREGGIIREGYDRELDELISVMRDGKQWIAALEEKERKRTGINSLKVGFNSVFGYYIEITKANTGLVPDDYVRKQTLVNAERYINQELKEYEYTVLNAENLRKEKEYNLFVMIRDQVGQEIRRVQTTASRIADLDAIVSLAEVAEKYNYTCPTVNEDDRIEIEDGRHPVVERMPLPDGFVPNDVCLDLDKNRLLIITGPNMAGKSTYIRQVALIVLLAQMGSFVPAAKAHIGVVDRVFTRVGAADSLARGQSTFMVEMNEVASILKNATPRSLIILDEVGRGTSTFDGLSIAWAVAEYIHDAKHLRTRTLFATHYHQLTDLAITKDGVKNFNIAVKEWGNSIIFLRKIMEGGTNRSYGIAVARIAGVPDEVILRAREILNNLERGELDEVGMPKIARGKKTTGKDKRQPGLFIADEDLIIAELKDLNVMNMTPLEALNLLGKWKDKLSKI